MKPSKKRTAKRTDNPIISKLLDLKYRINDAYRSYPCEANKNDKDWVIARIRDIRAIASLKTITCPLYTSARFKIFKKFCLASSFDSQSRFDLKGHSNAWLQPLQSSQLDS